MSAGGDVLVALAIAVGLVGVLVPVLPGLLLVWGAVGVWAWVVGTAGAWAAFGVVCALLVAGTVVKYVLPGRRLRSAGVPWSSTAVGGALGVIGFFVVPVVGLPLGFVLGVYLAELERLRAHDRAMASTRQALLAAGWSLLIELGAGLLMALTWVGALVLVR
jgi:uncharacterized protein YqgC (DUF456 family)